jgi:hypothetical protein
METKMEIEGSTFDWRGFNQAKLDRWEDILDDSMRCTKHNTTFNPHGHELFGYQDAEPCWQCHDEFNIKL